MSSARPPQSRRALLVLFAALVLAACTPGGDGGGDGEDGGPVTLTLTLNAVAGGKNAVEAEWVTDYVIPTFEKRMADEGKDVTVEFAGSGVDDEDYKNQLVLDLRVQGGPDVFAIDGPWTGEFAQAEYIKPLTEVAGDAVNDWEGWSQISDTVA
jgi:multiple sugar transport system substrate-binding protein